MNSHRTGKKVVITGGSRGIGAFAVRRFTALGATVAFLYNKSKDEAFALSKETGALAIRCDISNAKAVSSAMDVINEYMDGEIDVLICNAGVSDFNLITDIGAKRWNEVISTNLNGIYYCIDKILPGMISAKKGSIITVSSMWGQVGSSCEAAYSASKAGVIGLTKALAKELGPSGIRVNCIAPGMIDTDMNNNVSADIVREIVDETPLMRIGTPADVVSAMEFLASEKSSFITGQVIAVNGGLVI